MSIGTQLREARESQSISLDQVAQATHIRLHYLEALEADRFDSLPSAAQLRGFLRAYADYLKINSTQLIQKLSGDADESPAAASSPPVFEEPSALAVSSPAIFKEIGQKLRLQRELMGLSLGDVERHTHIRMHYVRALEEGDISHLPSPVQGRGMLSNYASFLGLNTETVLLRFADGLQASLYDRQVARDQDKKKASPNETERIPAMPSQMRRLFSMDFFVSGFLILFLLGFAVWGSMRIFSLRSAKVAPPTAPPVSEILLSAQGGVISATVTTLPGNGTPFAGTPLASPLAGTPLASPLATLNSVAEVTQVSLTVTPAALAPTQALSNAPIQVYIVAQQRTWMRVTVDGEMAFQGRTVPGSAYSYSATDQVVLLSGDGSGLQVYFNQQDLGPLGSYGQVVQRVFTIEGMQTATPAVLPTNTPAPTGTVTPTQTPTKTAIPNTPTPTPKP